CQQLVVIGGNHDSVSTLNESRELLACLNTFVVGGVTSNAEDQVKILKNKKGEPGAVICAIPFLRPKDVIETQAGESIEDKQQALQQAIADHYQNIYHEAEKLSDQSLPIIATGHLTTVGGQITESVREIYIGTLSAFPASAFPKADYIALGHLHRPQIVAGQEHIRYSGSPIALSFDEASTDKQVIIVDFQEEKLHSIESVPVPVFRHLISIKGSIDEIDQQLEALILDPCSLNSWLEIEVTTDVYFHDLQNRVEQLVLAKKKLHTCELLRVRKKREKTPSSLTIADRETLSELSVEDVFHQRLIQEELSEEQTQKLTSVFHSILNSIHDDKKEEIV
ncbi:MAG: exonuclease SbcCD subunit D C-terminal domain-containing protein, partial [Endozoicomonas sp.]